MSAPKKKAARFVLVQTESCDWYVIPLVKRKAWAAWEARSMSDPYANGSDEPPDWAEYVQDPGHVVFSDWKCTL